MNHATLDVISVYSNSPRFHSRERLFKQFQEYMEKEVKNVRHWSVETAFGDRAFRVTDPNNPRHIQLRTSHELWLKENMINIAMHRLPLDWEYVAWVDADIRFTRHDWPIETLHQLQHFDIVQMFSEARDLSPDHETFQVHKGFMWSYWNKMRTGADYEFWHPGYAWAARRPAIDHLGGLMEFPILGAADHHMAWSLVGEAVRSLPGNISKEYYDGVMLWQDKALKHIRKNVGYVPGSIDHYWHGKKKDRKYQERWDIITKNNFNPHTDIKPDWQGLLQLHDHGDERSRKLRDDVRLYFRQRNEDSIDME